MPRANLNSWASNAFKVVADNVNLPRFAFSTAAFGTGEEEAIAAAEIADGYSATVVGRATARRNKVSRIWVSPNGISVGLVPTDAQLGGPGCTRWLSLLPLSSLAFLNKRFGHEMPPFSVSNPTYHNAQVAAGYGSNGGWTKKAEGVRSFMREVTGLDLGTPVFRFRENANGATIWGGAKHHITTNRGPGKLLVAVQEFISETSDPDYTFSNSGAGGQRMMIWEFVTPPGFSGVQGIMFSCQGTNPRDLAGADAVRNIGGLWCTDVWRHLATVNTVRVITSYPSLHLAAGTVVNGLGIGLELIPAVPSTLWPAGATLLDNNDVDLASYAGRFIGGIEYAEGFSYFGDVSYDASKKEFRVADTQLSVDWLGSRLGQMALASGATQPQVDAVANLRVRSFMAANQVKVPTSLLKDLKPVKDGDVTVADLAAEIMFQADGDEAAVTFGEAESKAAGQNAQLVHQIVGGAVTQPVHPVVRVQQFPFNGGSQNLAVMGYDVVSRLYVNITSDEFMESVLLGASIDVLVGNSTFTTDTAFEEAIGLSYADVLAQQSAGDSGDDFDEAMLFRGSAANPANLTESKRAAFYLMQYARPRTTMSTFIISALLQGRQSYKQLIKEDIA